MRDRWLAEVLYSFCVRQASVCPARGPEPWGAAGIRVQVGGPLRSSARGLVAVCTFTEQPRPSSRIRSSQPRYGSRRDGMVCWAVPACGGRTRHAARVVVRPCQLADGRAARHPVHRSAGQDRRLHRLDAPQGDARGIRPARNRKVAGSRVSVSAPRDRRRVPSEARSHHRNELILRSSRTEQRTSSSTLGQSLSASRRRSRQTIGNRALSS